MRSFLGDDAPNITEAKLMDPRTLIVLGIAPVRIGVLTSIDTPRTRRFQAAANEGTPCSAARTRDERLVNPSGEY